MKNKLKIKDINYIDFFRKNKAFLKHIIIDVIFYAYISIIFALISFVSYIYKIDFKVSSAIWVIGFVIIFIFKLKKDFK